MTIASQFSTPHKPESFNMTPLIDIVFLLIIFFLVVCQFIEAENFPVTVPDDCEFARDQAEYQRQITTVTVMKTSQGNVDFAVGPQKINELEGTVIIGRIAELIDTGFKELPPDSRVVTLRIDKDVCFSQAQYALAGVAASIATDIQLAALRDKHLGSQ